jgi:hypothetical protein
VCRSISEGFGNPPAQAAATGDPVRVNFLFLASIPGRSLFIVLPLMLLYRFSAPRQSVLNRSRFPGDMLVVHLFIEDTCTPNMTPATEGQSSIHA